MNLFPIARVFISSRGFAYRKGDWFKKELAGIGYRSHKLKRELGPSYQPEEDEELDEEQDFSNLDKMYDSHKEELARRRKIGSYKNVERRHFKKEKQPNMLMWAAKEQIRYLYHTNPEEWPMHRLAEGFSVSEEAIKKIIKSRYVVKPDRVERHDRNVVENWAKLGYKNGPVYSITRSSDFTAAIENYKLEKESEVKEISSGSEPRKIGLFEKIVKEYRVKVEELNAKEAVDSGQKLIEGGNGEPRSRTRTSLEDQGSGGEQTTELRVEPLKNPRRDSGQRQAKKELVKGDTISPRDSVTSPAPPLHVDQVLASTRTPSKKFKENQEEFIVDKSRSGELDAYKYQEDTGYQRPWGRERFSPPETIEIPSEKKKRGEIYRVGNAYYDEQGRFLYSVPIS